MYARVLAVMPLLLSLAACQGAAVKPDYDLTHDFAGDQTWEWAEPRVEFRPSDDPRIGGELMAGRIEQAVAEQLDSFQLPPDDVHVKAVARDKCARG